MQATNQGWIDKDHTIKQGAGMHVELICNGNNWLQQFIEYYIYYIYIYILYIYIYIDIRKKKIYFEYQ